jgi:hypothetical protein
MFKSYLYPRTLSMKIEKLIDYLKYLFFLLLLIRIGIEYENLFKFRISYFFILSLFVFIFSFRNKYVWHFGIAFFVYAFLYYFSEERKVISYLKDYEFLTPLYELFRVFGSQKIKDWNIVLRVIPFFSYPVFILLFFHNRVRKIYGV